MDSTNNPPMANVLKYSGVVLPLIAVAVWLAGPHQPVIGPLPSRSPYVWRLIIIHGLLAGTIFLQGCRFMYFLRQKLIGGLLVAAGSVYGAMIVIFRLTANLR